MAVVKVPGMKVYQICDSLIYVDLQLLADGTATGSTVSFFDLSQIIVPEVVGHMLCGFKPSRRNEPSGLSLQV
jgi:hypothetical protein